MEGAGGGTAGGTRPPRVVEGACCSPPDGASPQLVAAVEALPTAMEPADDAAGPGKVKGCPVEAGEPKDGTVPKGVLLPIELLPKGKLLPIVLPPKGILLKGTPLVMPNPPLLAAEVLLLLPAEMPKPVAALEAASAAAGAFGARAPSFSFAFFC